MILYRADLHENEGGLEVWFKEFVVMRETPCYYICSKLHFTKEKKIHKTSSRFAFKSKELALENLRYRKRKQIQHMKRGLAFNEAFLESKARPSLGDYVVIDGTRDLVHQYIAFD